MSARSITWESNHPPVGKCVGECYGAYKIPDAKRREAEGLLAAATADFGKKVYTACAACHGVNGEGGVISRPDQGRHRFDAHAIQKRRDAGRTERLNVGPVGALSAEDIANISRTFVESL